MTAKEYERYGNNIPAAAPMTRIKRAKAKGQHDEALAPNPAKSARVETALPGLTTALAKAGEIQRRQHAEATRESEMRTVLRSASRQRRGGVSDPASPPAPRERSREGTWQSWGESEWQRQQQWHSPQQQYGCGTSSGGWSRRWQRDTDAASTAAPPRDASEQERPWSGHDEGWREEGWRDRYDRSDRGPREEHHHQSWRDVASPPPHQPRAPPPQHIAAIAVPKSSASSVANVGLWWTAARGWWAQWAKLSDR